MIYLSWLLDAVPASWVSYVLTFQSAIPWVLSPNDIPLPKACCSIPALTVLSALTRFCSLGLTVAHVRLPQWILLPQCMGLPHGRVPGISSHHSDHFTLLCLGGFESPLGAEQKDPVHFSDILCISLLVAQAAPDLFRQQICLVPAVGRPFSPTHRWPFFNPVSFHLTHLVPCNPLKICDTPFFPLLLPL